MNESKYELRLLDVCLPDYFQGYSGEFPTLIAFVDNESTYQDMIESLEYNTNNDAHDSDEFWEAFEQAIKDFPNQLGPSDCMTNKAFPDLEPCDCDPDNHICNSIVAYFAIEKID